MKRDVRILIAILMWLSLGITNTSSANELVVAFPEGDYSPHYDSTHGEMRGFLPALMHRFSEYSGQPLSLIGLPIKRYQAYIHSGEIDFILPSNPDWSDNNKGNLLYSSVIMISRSGFVRTEAHLGTPIRRIATVTAYTLPAINPAYLSKEPKVYRTFDTHASLNMLKADRVDATYAHLDFVREWVRKNNVTQQIYFEADAGFDNFSYHLATKNHGAIIRKFDDWLRRYRADVLTLMKEYKVGTDMKLN